jgi:hypothetical protein
MKLINNLLADPVLRIPTTEKPYDIKPFSVSVSNPLKLFSENDAVDTKIDMNVVTCDRELSRRCRMLLS